MKSVSVALGVFIAGAACGSVNSNPGDAGGGVIDSGSGQIDSGPGQIDSGPGSARGTVQVTVVDPSGSGVPAVGVTVVFIDPDGTVVKTASSDSMGKASADVLPGASVTTVAPGPGAFRLRTLLAVKPGDELVIGPKVIDTRTSGSFTLTWPDSPLHATTFSVYGPCGFVGLTTFNPSVPPTAPTTLTFGLQNGCRPETGEFLIWARGQEGTSLHFNVIANVPITAGGSFALPNMWNGGFRFSAAYTNAATISTITADRIIPDGGRSAPVTMPATDTTSISLPGASAASARMVSRFSSTSGATQTVRQKVPGGATTYALNVNATLLAWLNPPTFNAASQELQLVKIAPNAGGAPAPDLLKVTASWQRGATQYTWEVFGPEASTVKLPALPDAAGAGLNPTSTDAVQAVATSYEAETVPGYDAVRGNVGAAITDVFEAPRSPAALIRVSNSPPLPATGGELR